MANLTQEEIDFLKSQGLPVPDQEPEISTTTEQTSFSQNDLLPDELVYGGTEQDWKDYTDRLVAENAPATAPVTQETRDAFTYDNMYGQYPDPTTGELKDKPDISIFTRLGAMYYDMFNPEGADLKPSQVERNQYSKDRADWETATREIYNGTSFYSEPTSGIRGTLRTYDRYVPVLDEQGNVTDYRYEKVRIPDPTMDESTFNRMMDQAGKNIYQEVGGFLTEGAVLAETELSRNTADFDQAGGEAIGTTILSLAAPGMVLAKPFRYGGKLLKYGKNVGKGGELGVKGTIAAESIGVSLAEAIMSKEGDEGLFIKAPVVKEALPWLDDPQAENVAIFLDGMVVNGMADGLLSIVGSGLGFIGGKLSAGTKLANREALRNAVTDGTMLEIVKYLDPEIAGLNAVDTKLRINALMSVLNNNQTIELALGNAKRTIDNDSTNAIMMGSEAYIRETRAGLKDSMTPEAFEEMVQQKAAEMSSSMIGLFRSQQGNPVVQAGVDKVPEQIGEFIQDTAVDLAGGADNAIDTAAQNVAQEVVRASDQTVSGLTNQIDDVSRQTDEILDAQATVLETNPILQDFITENTGGYGLFGTNNSEMRQALTEIVSTEAYGAYKVAMDGVDAAYAALPTAEIDAALLKDKLTEVTRAVNAIDGSGNRAAAVLRDVFEGFEPKRVGTRTDPMPIVGEATEEAVMETTEQAIDRIAKELTFKDLYDLKGRLATVIDSYRDDPTIQRRLIEFRNHITDSETGQMAHVIDTAPQSVAKAYKDADNLYKTAMADFANSEPVRRLTDKFADQRRFDTPQGEIPGNYGRNEPDVIMGSDQFVDEAIGDGTGTLMKQLDTMLAGVRSGAELNGAFRDLFRAQAANALRDAVASGASRGAADPEQILFNAVKPYREQLQSLGDTGLLSELETAFNQVKSAYGSLGDIKLANDALIKEIDDQIAAAQAGIVGQLIDVPMAQAGRGITGPARSTVTSSAKDKLQSIMTSANSENRMNELLGKIAQIPDEASRTLAMDALQAVSLDVLGSKIFGASMGALKSGTEARRNINLGTVARLTDDQAGNLFKSINTIYGKDSNMSDAVVGLVNMMYQTSIPSRLRVSQAGSDTIINAARNENIRDAVSTAILLTAGYMNPTAAMLRRITSVPVEQAEKLQKEVAAHVLATVVADPKKFASMLDELANGRSSTADEIARTLTSSIAGESLLGVRYEVRVQEEDAFGEEDRGPYADRDMMQLFGLYK